MAAPFFTCFRRARGDAKSERGVRFSSLGRLAAVNQGAAVQNGAKQRFSCLLR